VKAPASASRNFDWLVWNASSEASRYCGTIDCIESPYMPISCLRKLIGSIVLPRDSSSMMIWVRTLCVMSSPERASTTLNSRFCRTISASRSSVM
jgi:hypothetical protein